MLSGASRLSFMFVFHLSRERYLERLSISYLEIYCFFPTLYFYLQIRLVDGVGGDVNQHPQLQKRGTVLEKTRPC